MGLAWILLVTAVLAVTIVTVRRVRRMECYRDATTGETWEPRFLIVMYRGPAYRDADGKMWHGNANESISEDEKQRAIWWGCLLVTAEAYGIPVEETPWAAQYGCNWCRTYDLKTAPKRRREVMYAMASMLVDQCREAGVSACARIIGERDARPFGVSRFSEFAESNAALAKVFDDGMFLVLAHANIAELAHKDVVLRRLLRRRITPDEMLDGMRWFVGDSRRAA